MKNIWVKIFLYILIFFVFLFLVPLKVYKKNIYYFDESVNFSKKSFASSSKIDAYYSSDSEVKYINFSEGLVNEVNTFGYNKTIYANKYFYLIYDGNENRTDIYSVDNKFIAAVSSGSYPYIPEELPYFYLIRDDGMGLSLYSMNGKKAYDEINFSSMITSVSIDKNINTLVSTIDGMSYLYNSKKEKLFEVKAKGSKINITKSNIFDSDGKYFALCSGLDPEYVEVYRIKKTKRILNVKTGTDFRYRSILFIAKNRVYFEGENCIRYNDFNFGKKGLFRTKGEINEAKVDNNGNLIVSSTFKDMHIFTIFSYNGEIIYYNEFSSPVFNINFIDSTTLCFIVSNELIKLKYGTKT